MCFEARLSENVVDSSTTTVDCEMSEGTVVCPNSVFLGKVVDLSI